MDESDVSGLLSVNKFLENCEDSVKDAAYFGQESTSFQQYIKSRMTISDDMIEELNCVTGKKTLECDGEPSNALDLLKSVPPDSQLHTVQIQKDKLGSTDAASYQKKQPDKRSRYHFNDGPWKQALIAVQDATSENSNTISHENPQVIMDVRIHKHYNPKKFKGCALNVHSHYHVLGCQLLTELRDVIECAADNACVGEYSDMPDLTVDVTAKEMYQSGFFYIEGVFYNDMRDPNCRDYSKTIIEWAKESNRGIGPFATKTMASTRFQDLNVRIGQPYVYLHQGDCEHIIVFTDLRMLHPSECHDVSKYPLQLYKARDFKTKCRVCLMNTARWVTRESSLSPEDPCFFCETCFRAFHYDIDGNKLDNFKAYHLPKT